MIGPLSQDQREALAKKVFANSKGREAMEISDEDLLAAAQVWDDLVAGVHYSKQEAAMEKMFGVNPHRRVYLEDPGRDGQQKPNQ